MHGTVCAPIQNVVMCICIGFEDIKQHSIFPTTKGLMNECMELVGLNTSNMVKNMCFKMKVVETPLFKKLLLECM